MASELRAGFIGRALESFVVWARVLDSHRTFVFEGMQLTRAQLEALFLIAHSDEPVTPGLLADALDITPGAVTQLVAGLVDRDLVRQEPHADDGRRRVLALSSASRTQVEGFERALTDRLAPRFDGLTDEELRTLAVLLRSTTERPPMPDGTNPDSAELGVAPADR